MCSSTGKYYRIIDYSEPLFGITFLLGIVGIIYNIIELENFDLAVSCFLSFGSLIALWRVKKLGIASLLMDSVDNLREENENLRESIREFERENSKLAETERMLNSEVYKFKKDIQSFRDLVGIVDTSNKNAEDIQKELFDLVEKYRVENRKYKKENDRLERNNRLALFYTVDYNRDGKLTNEEINEIKKILKDEYNITGVIDENGDGVISRGEMMKIIFDKTHPKKLESESDK